MSVLQKLAWNDFGSFILKKAIIRDHQSGWETTVIKSLKAQMEKLDGAVCLFF